jgi:hypothetical protein
MEFGRPYELNDKIKKEYSRGDKRKAVSVVLKDIEERVNEILLTAPSYNELQAIYIARRLFLPNNMP